MKNILIHGGDIIPCTGDGILKNHSVLIEEGRIAAIIPQDTQLDTEEAEIIDAAGKFILPGLINCHEHVLSNPDNLSSAPEVYEHVIMYGTKNLETLLNHGFTTVRSMADFHNLEMVFRDAVEEGIINGPSLVVTGIALSATGGHLSEKLHCCDTVALAEQYTQEQLAKGADFIKVMVTGGVTTAGTADEVKIDEECLRAIVKIAHASGKKVSTHCIGGKGVQMAVRAGVDCIEHGSGLAAESAALMKQNNIFLVPTLMPAYMNAVCPKNKGLPEFIKTKSEEYLAASREAIALAHREGLRIVMGTDGGAVNTPHETGAFELKLLHDAGLTPMECILAATRDAADLLELLEDRGTVEVGKRADLIIVDENPLDNLEVLQHVTHVIQMGMLVR